MHITQTIKLTEIITFTATEDGKEIGRASLVLIYNQLHKEPYGLLEDVFVDEAYRGKGLGTDLVARVIDEAKKRGCYTLRATSRDERPEVHAWYEKIGLKKYGRAFRLDL